MIIQYSEGKIKNLIRNQNLQNSIAEGRWKMEDGRWKNQELN
ncbi:hypothetical protein [Okeania sp. SIO3B5]|nr:hypothetical protein [Okeania sp. SIO3B5]